VEKSYILRFPSMEERSAFLEWQAASLPAHSVNIQTSSNLSDLVVTKIDEGKLAALRAAPHSFQVFDDFNFKPSLE
jgi:hypothetical protein